jgi:hypothetical protein
LTILVEQYTTTTTGRMTMATYKVGYYLNDGTTATYKQHAALADVITEAKRFCRLWIIWDETGKVVACE